MSDHAHHDDQKHSADDDLHQSQTHRHEDQAHQQERGQQHGSREHVAAWRREFNQLTNNSCCGPDGRLDFEKVKAWQMAHQIEATGTIRRDTIEMARSAADARDDAHGDHSHKHHGVGAEHLPLMPLPQEWTDYLQKHPGVAGLRGLVTTIIAEWSAGTLDELEVQRKWNACADFCGALPNHKSEVHSLWSTIAWHLAKGREGDKGQGGAQHDDAPPAHGGGAHGSAAHGEGAGHGGAGPSWLEPAGQDRLKKDPEHTLPYLAVNYIASDFAQGTIKMPEMEQRFAELATFANANATLRSKAHSLMMEKALRKMKDGASPFADANHHNPDEIPGLPESQQLQMSPEQATLMMHGGAQAVEWSAAQVLLPAFSQSHLNYEQVMQRFDECVRLSRIGKSDEKRIRALLEKGIKEVRGRRKREHDAEVARVRWEQKVMDEDDVGDA